MLGSAIAVSISDIPFDGPTATTQVGLIDGEFVLYTVRKGENLWSIAKKYPGVSNKDIMRWNGISENQVKDIRPGQKLKIKI